MFQNHKPLVRNSGLGGAASTAQWLDSVLIASISREFSYKPLAEAMGFLTKIAADSHLAAASLRASLILPSILADPINNQLLCCSWKFGLIS